MIVLDNFTFFKFLSTSEQQKGEIRLYALRIRITGLSSSPSDSANLLCAFALFAIPLFLKGFALSSFYFDYSLSAR